eukprot:4896963-Prymnesium_polylepis.1
MEDASNYNPMSTWYSPDTLPRPHTPRAQATHRQAVCTPSSFPASALALACATRSHLCSLNPHPQAATLFPPPLPSQSLTALTTHPVCPPRVLNAPPPSHRACHRDGGEAACRFVVFGCTDPHDLAVNPNATILYPPACESIYGCMDSN